MIQKLINFLNNCDLKKLNQGLDELDKKIEEIFLKSNASIDDETLSVIQNKSSYFFCWFCFFWYWLCSLFCLWFITIVG